MLFLDLVVLALWFAKQWPARSQNLIFHDSIFYRLIHIFYQCYWPFLIGWEGVSRTPHFSPSYIYSVFLK
jgi:hypothetical protein